MVPLLVFVEYRLTQGCAPHTHTHTHTQTHRVPEAVVFVDVSGAGDQLDAVPQTHAPPLGLAELRCRDVVHIPRLAALVHHVLLTEAQTAIVLPDTRTHTHRS